jgi:hypothetical protein
VNILKKFRFFYLILATFSLFSCSKDIHFSGISEASFIQLNESYLTQELTKSDVIEMLGAPLVTENSETYGFIELKKNRAMQRLKKSLQQDLKTIF